MRVWIKSWPTDFSNLGRFLVRQCLILVFKNKTKFLNSLEQTCNSSLQSEHPFNSSALSKRLDYISFPFQPKILSSWVHLHISLFFKYKILRSQVLATKVKNKKENWQLIMQKKPIIFFFSLHLLSFVDGEG